MNRDAAKELIVSKTSCAAQVTASVQGRPGDVRSGDGGVDVDKDDHQQVEDGADDAQHR